MRKTIACMALVIGTIAMVDASAKDTKREPASAETEGFTFAACKPAYNIYEGNEAYKNNCNVDLKEVKVPGGGMSRGTRTVMACDAEHVMVVSSRPINTRCLPPGAVEL